MQNFDCPNTIYGQVGKSIKHVLQHLFTMCPNLHVSRLYPNKSPATLYLRQWLVNRRGKNRAILVKLVLVKCIDALVTRP